MRFHSGKGSNFFATVHVARGIRLIGLAVVMMTLAGSGLLIWSERQSDIAEGQARVTGLALVLAEKTRHYTHRIDLLLQDVQKHVAGLGPLTAEQFKVDLRNDKTAAFLRERVQTFPTNVVILIDASGRVVNASNDPAGFAAVDFADRDYFRHFSSHNDNALYVGSPVRSRVSGAWVIPLARVITTAQGEFLGIVLSALDIQYLTEFYKRVLLDQSGFIALVRRDGVVLAAGTLDVSRLRLQVPAGTVCYHMVAAGIQGYRSADHFSGLPSIAAVHAVDDYDFVVDVSMSEAAVLADWRKMAIALATVGGAVAAGFALMFIVVSRQFEQLVHRNARLAESERRVRDFAEMASDWFWEQDADLKFTWLSEGAPTIRAGDASYIGKTRWELAGIAMEDVQLVSHQADVAAGRAFRDYRYSRVGKDGLLRHFSIGGTPIFNEHGDFSGYRGVGRDITAQVLAEDELRRAREVAESASRAKSAFLANMGHELRTPLNAIIGFAELIRDRPGRQVGNPHQDYAREIDTSGRQLLNLINDLLDMARLDAGSYQMTEGTVDVAAAINACVEAISRVMPNSGVTISHIPNESRLAIRADVHAVQKIVYHILSNAVKFTPAGGRVVVRAFLADTGGLEIAIQDTGVGIDEEVRRRAFEPFYQADQSIRRQFGGSGLGLSITRGLLNLHGGSFQIEGAPGCGTSVQIRFPVERTMAY